MGENIIFYQDQYFKKKKHISEDSRIQTYKVTKIYVHFYYRHCTVPIVSPELQKIQT